MPKLKHYDLLGTARFVTFTCYQRQPYLMSPVARQVLVEGLQHLRTSRHVRILGWVIMPEHMHLVLHPPVGLELGKAIGRYKSWTARQILSDPEIAGTAPYRTTGKRALWQRRCYDHNCRTLEVTHGKISYCHNNPVKRGLVGHPSQWLWSSYNWYTNQGPVILEIDGAPQ